jgi:hypothetical protein
MSLKHIQAPIAALPSSVMNSRRLMSDLRIPGKSRSHGDARGTSYACFSFVCKVARELTQGSAERNQFCRRGTKSRRWRKIPTRTM